MAGRIAGITIEIGGDTTKLQTSLKNVDKQLKTTQGNLKDIDKLLKLNPGSTELLTQKQKNLESALNLTKERLEELNKAQEGVEKGSAEWDALQREIIETEGNLKNLQQQYKDFGTVASQQIKNVGDSLKTAGGKVEDFGKKLTPVSATATALGTGLLKLGYDAVTSADDLNTLAKQTGFSTEEIQKMQYAADLIDVSFEDIAGALKKFKSKVDPANKSLQQLGVATTNSDGSLRDATDVFQDAIKALSLIENETERDQLAMELFGKSADQLAGIIDDGGQALAEYGQEAEDLGLIMGQDTIDSLNEVNDTIDKMKAQIAGTMAVIGAQVVPVVAPLLEKAGELVANVAQKLSELNPQTMETILKVVGIAAALAPVIILGGKLITGLGSIISVIGTVVGVLGGPLTLAIAGVIAVGVLLYKNWDKVKATAENLATRVKTSWENIKTAVNTAIEAVQGKVDDLKERFETLKDKVVGVWETIKGILTGSISLPHIPLPHFSIQPPGWKFSDLLQGEIPSLGITWYKKAYDNPVMFTSPTVMATPGGLKGFGDGSGAEIVMGLDKLREVVGSAGGVTINVYASPGMDVNQLADKIQQKYVAAARQRRLLNA